MVSPSENWDDTENGYEYEGMSLTVAPTTVRWTRNGLEQSAHGYSVDAHYGYGSHREIATFADARTAWEFANGLTWYLEIMGERQYGETLELGYALRDLVDGQNKVTESTDWSPPPVIKSLGAFEVLSRLRGNVVSIGQTVEEIRTIASEHTT